MSRNPIVAFAATAALSLACLAPAAAMARAAFGHVSAVSGSTRLLTVSSSPSPQQRPPQRPPAKVLVGGKGLSNLCQTGGCYPATIGPGHNGFAGQLPAGPHLPR
jgi:hypothetical protein